MLGTVGHTDALLLAPVALDRLAGEAARRWSAASGREVRVDAPEPVAVLADEERLRHALDALVENALNATEADDEVTIAAHVRGGRAVLAVSDTGVGIAPEDRDRIFERFVRGAARRAPPRHRARPADRAGDRARPTAGASQLESRPGEGATFTMTLGAPLPAARTAPVPASGAHPAPAGSA